MFEIVEDDGICEELLSFCDFRSTVMVGRTCRRLQSLSDTVLDRSVEKALTQLPIYHENFTHDSESWARANLKTGWSTNYRSRAALVDLALTHCAPDRHTYCSYREELEYDEETARFLLRSRGVVDVDDFLADDSDAKTESLTDEEGWDVRIAYRAIFTLTMAAVHIAKATKQINNAGSDDGREHKTAEGVKRLRHCMLCLLRKADPASIRFSQLITNTRHVAYPLGEKNTFLSFRIPDHTNTEIEFHLETGYRAW